MKVNDFLTGVPVGAPELTDSENPFQDADLFLDAQITRIVVDVMSGTAGIIFELRQSERLSANTGLLRVTRVAQQNWICTAIADEHTAWSISRATVYQRPGEFQLVAQCLPAGALRVVGASAEFILLDAASTSAPPERGAESPELIRFGTVDGNADCKVVGVARSVQTAMV